MAVEKLSISLDSELADAVRKGAAQEETSVSNWLAEAARSRARSLALVSALAILDEEFGPVSEAEQVRIVTEVRARSIVTGPLRAAR